MRPLLALALVLSLFAVSEAGILTPKKTLSRHRQTAPVVVQPAAPVNETAQFRRQPNCPDGRCPITPQQPQPQPLPKFDIDFEDETPQSEPAAPVVAEASNGLSKLDAIVALISAISGAIAAFIATREDDDEEKDTPPPGAPHPQGG